MGGTLRLMGGVQRWAPRAGDAGGLLLWCWWMVLARDLPLPGTARAMLGLAVAALLSVAVLGYQFAQGTAGRAWWGWAGAATLIQGSFLGSPREVAAGLALWGLSVVACGVLPRTPGLMLVGAGTALFLMSAVAVEFVRAEGMVGAVWRGLTGLALVVVAAALADLDAAVHDRTDPVALKV